MNYDHTASRIGNFSTTLLWIHFSHYILLLYNLYNYYSDERSIIKPSRLQKLQNVQLYYVLQCLQKIKDIIIIITLKLHCNR